MKLDLNKSVIDLAGKELPNSNMGKLLASMLVNGTKGDPMKLFHWAQKLYAGELLELDPTDAEVLKTIIRENDQITILSKAQMLACFKEK